MRLFAAIQLSPAVREALLTAQADLRRQGRGSFPPPENLHLTLAFLGETADLPGARAALNAAACRPFTLAVGGTLGHFGDLTRPWRTWPCPCRRTSGPGAFAWRTAPSVPISPWSAAGRARTRR